MSGSSTTSTRIVSSIPAGRETVYVAVRGGYGPAPASTCSPCKPAALSSMRPSPVPERRSRGSPPSQPHLPNPVPPSMPARLLVLARRLAAPAITPSRHGRTASSRGALPARRLRKDSSVESPQSNRHGRDFITISSSPERYSLSSEPLAGRSPRARTAPAWPAEDLVALPVAALQPSSGPLSVTADQTNRVCSRAT